MAWIREKAIDVAAQIRSWFCLVREALTILIALTIPSWDWFYAPLVIHGRVNGRVVFLGGASAAEFTSASIFWHLCDEHVLSQLVSLSERCKVSGSKIRLDGAITSTSYEVPHGFKLEIDLGAETVTLTHNAQSVNGPQCVHGPVKIRRGLIGLDVALEHILGRNPCGGKPLRRPRVPKAT